MLKFCGLAAIAIAPLAVAQTQAKRSQGIRAGVVIIDSANAGGRPARSAAPHAWFMLNSDRWVKPASWNIYNPNAPSTLANVAPLPDGRLRGWQRWNAIDPTFTPPVDTPLTKRHAAYWEVFLSDTSDAAMSQYDVLLLNPKYFASLNPLEREKLRRFVDRGGLLWIDPAGLNGSGSTSVDMANNFPYAFAPYNVNSPTVRNDFTQPLLTSPHAISAEEMELINNDSASKFVMGPVDVTATMQQYVGGVVLEFQKYQPVSLVSTSPSIAIAHIGDGAIVVTARGASLKLNRPFGATMTSNIRFSAADPVFDRDTYASAKLAVNMISLLTEFRQGAGGSRKSGSSAIDIGAPLIRRTATQGSVTSAPTVFKGMVVATLNDRLIVYDADPYRDLDGDGNSDDGMPDLAFGASEDVVWMSAPMPGPVSTASCIDVPNSIIKDDRNVAVKDQALVVDSTGTVRVFDLGRKFNGVFSNDPTTDGAAINSRQPVASIAPPNGAPDNSSRTPNSVTIHEGMGYVSDLVTPGGLGGGLRGRLWVIDLAAGAIMSSEKPWYLGGVGSPAQQLPPFANSPSVGYIQIQDNSGGMDRVAYLPFNASSNGVPSAGVISLWLGAKGERPSDYEPKDNNTGNALVITTRASQQGGLPIYLPTFPSPMGVKLSLVTATGDVLNAGQMNAIFDGSAPTDLGGGVLSFKFRTGVTQLPPNVKGVRIDYWIDLGDGDSGTLAQIERGRVNLPDKTSGAIDTVRRKILGPVALSPSGSFFVVSQQQPSGTLNPDGANDYRDRGGVYGFREEGRGLFKMIMRWEMYRTHSIQKNGAERVTYPGTLFDMDPFRLMVFEATGLKFSGELKEARLIGGPVIRNGQVFVTARVTQSIGFAAVPSTVVMAFKADPEIAQVKVGDLPDGSQILQMDVARSNNPNIPEVPSILAGANYSYDSRTGTVRFENLATVQKGVIQNSISLSQPIIIRRPGMPDELLEPEAPIVLRLGTTGRGARWNPMLWYSVIQGLDVSNAGPPNDTVPSNGAFASGDTLYVAGRSYTASALRGGPLTPQGVLYAIRTDVSPNDPYLFSMDPLAEANNRPGMLKVRPPIAPERPWLSQFSQMRISGPAGPNSAFEANPGFLWPQLRGVASVDDYLVRINQTSLSGNGANSTSARGVVGGDGALIAWGDRGLYTFSKTDFLVADEGRIAQFDPSGNMLWSTSASGTAGETSTNPTGNVRPLVKPSRAYRMSAGQILIVDTGGNRVAMLDQTGAETRTISDFKLDPNAVPAGFELNETLALKAPRDVLMYTTYEQPGVSKLVTRGDGMAVTAWEYWVHYLVADSGNNRLVEVIDRFKWDINRGLIGTTVTVNNQPQLGVLFWHSPANVSGKQFAYNSINRTWMTTSGQGRYVYVAGIGGGLPTKVDTGLDPSGGAGTTRESRDGNGGIVIFDPANPRGTVVFNKVAIPGFGANVFYNPSTKTFNSPASTGSPRPIGEVGSVTTRLVPNGGTGALAIMFTDPAGVYEAIYDGSPDPGEVLSLRWMLPNEAYRVLRGLQGDGSPKNNNLPLRATFARRLDSGDILIVNGYYGRRYGGEATGGEVLQLDGTPNAGGTITATNMGFGPTSIMFELPPISGARGLVTPVFADRR
ncbi:MAG: hypothetical protein ACAH95_17455 [Fimbriimonas sp.]